MMTINKPLTFNDSSKPHRRFVYIEKRTRAEQEANPSYAPIECAEEPAEVWLLAGFDDKEMPRPKDIELVHGRTAFLEDRGHDWSWRDGKLRYSPGGERCGGVWLCLVFGPTHNTAPSEPIAWKVGDRFIDDEGDRGTVQLVNGELIFVFDDADFGSVCVAAVIHGYGPQFMRDAYEVGTETLEAARTQLLDELAPPRVYLLALELTEPTQYGINTALAAGAAKIEHLIPADLPAGWTWGSGYVSNKYGGGTISVNKITHELFVSESAKRAPLQAVAAALARFLGGVERPPKLEDDADALQAIELLKTRGFSPDDVREAMQRPSEET